MSDSGNTTRPDVAEPSTRSRFAGRDLVRTRSVVWIWGIPAAAVIITESGWHGHWMSSTAAGIIWTISTAWIGIACLVNSYRCRRFHCLFDGILLTPLSLVALLNVTGVISIGWQMYIDILVAIVIIGFIPECCGLRYLSQDSK